MPICKVTQGTAVLLSQERCNISLLSVASFDRAAPIAASFPSITHQQQGEAVATLKLNYNIHTYVTFCQPYSNYFLTLFFNIYIKIERNVR